MKVLREVEERFYAGNDIRLVKYEEGESKWNFAIESRPILLQPLPGEEEPWLIMGGSVGYNESAFLTLDEAEAFLKKGLKEEEKNPEIWLEMLECE